MKLNVRENQIVFFRLLTLATGFTLNLLTANLIIEWSGEVDYAIFALIASFPALLTFIDFGMGNAAYNISVQLNSDNSAKDKRILNNLSSIVLMSIFLTTAVLVLLFGIYTLYPEYFRVTLLGQEVAWRSSVIALVLICLSTPLALAYKVLLALGRNSQVIFLQATIPFLTFLLALLGTQTNFKFFIYLAFPISLLLVAIFAFKETRILKYLQLRHAFTLARKNARNLINHGLLSVTMMLLANITSFLPRYILARESDHSQLVQLSFMLMYFSSAQSIISSEGQAISTEIRSKKLGNDRDLIRKGMVRCLVIAVFTSLGLLSLSILNTISPFTLISLQQAIFTSIILCIWSLQVIPNFLNSQTRNICFFIVVYLLALTYSLVAWNLFDANNFTQTFWQILLPSNMIMSFGVIAYFKFGIRH